MARLNVGESLFISLSSLWSNKMRTFLTLLGIIIGVLTIIAVVSVIQGLNNYVYTKMSFFGANDFSVSKFSLIGMSLKEFKEQMKRKDLTFKEMELLRRECRSCELVGASASASRTVKAGSQSLRNVDIRGVTHLDHNIGTVLELEAGRQLGKEDETHSRLVCIVGFDIKEKLFPFTDPLGQWIKIGPDNFLVVGLGKKKGKLLGFSQDNYVRIPISTFLKIYGSRRSLSINIHTSSQERMRAAQEEVRTILRSARHRSFNDPDDFSIQTSETFIQFYKNATSSIYFAMIAISSIALLVGGIVIMNIMLVSVTERTKEIGIRMAVGARRQDILFQFLIESAVISGTGGVIGIILGLSLAILVSSSIGLFFGIYPANKAAKLNPTDALRSEQ
jgi:putative ABC transport system permease protein